MRGLDPRIHPARISSLMDCRVKPGNDDPEKIGGPQAADRVVRCVRD
jgi:hypothetical protein